MAQSNEQGGELVDFMGKLGFEYYDGEYYKYFHMNEGTCKVTIDGAVEMKKRYAKDRKQHELEAELKALDFAWNSTDLMVKERIAELKEERHES